MADKITSSQSKKALCIRLDRIGDLILSLPVDQLPELAEYQVTWMIPRYLSFVPRLAQPARRFIEWDKKFGFKSFFDFCSWLKRNPQDLAIVFHAPWWVSLALFISGVKLRLGVKSQWHSFLFLNCGIRQNRSQALYSELIYNQDLVKSGLSHSPAHKLVVPALKMQISNSEEVLQKFGLVSQKYYVVHPGMGGSARNWSAVNYAELVRRLCKNNIVVITGTEADQPYIEPVFKELTKNNPPDEHHLLWLDSKLSTYEMVAVVQNAKGVVAPSTGVVHIAASTSAPTIGLYSPVLVQAPRRWAPLGKAVTILMPNVECPGERRCLQDACKQFDCMKQISVEQVLEQMT